MNENDITPLFKKGTKMIRSMAMEHSFGLMEGSTSGTGKKESNMEEAHSLKQMVKVGKENGLMGEE